jgi:aminoglycoside phosphotransferase (APT) family kinase protein
MADPTGWDVAEVDAWLAEHVPELQQPLRWTVLVGGHSNLTAMIETADGKKAVVRRPPTGELQPRAHDMAREFKVISGLWPTDVPVARPYALCTDTAVTGAVFYVMGHVQGHSGSTEWLTTAAERSTVSESYIDALASLHRLDVDEIGIGDMASHENYIGRQLKSWYRSWTSNAEATAADDPRAHELHDWLAAHAPEQGRPSLVHGDYGFHNLIIGDDARVAAVVDWEVCTFGPGLSDLAFTINRWSPTRGLPEGFWTTDEVVARYEERTGADLGDLDFYVAFNHWRSSCIQQGVYTRYARAQRPVEGVDFEHFRRAYESRLGVAEAAVAKLR